MPLSICTAVSANCPEYGMIRPILTVSCATAASVADRHAAAAAAIMLMVAPPCLPCGCRARQSALFIFVDAPVDAQKYAGQLVLIAGCQLSNLKNKGADPGPLIASGGGGHGRTSMKRSTDRI